MAGCFSHKASDVTIVHALQQLKMQKVCARWIRRQLTEHQKNIMGVALDFLTQYREDRNDLLKQKITGNEGWIHFFF